MQCKECKWFSIGANDHYGVCKRFPENQNKNQTDFCGEFNQKEVVRKFKIEWEEPVQIEVVPEVVEKPKRGRKPKNVD